MNIYSVWRLFDITAFFIFLERRPSFLSWSQNSLKMAARVMNCCVPEYSFAENAAE